MPKIIDGTEVSRQVKEECKQEIAYLRGKGYRMPNLSVLLIGNHGPSVIYVNSKKKIAQEMGMNFDLYHLEETVTQQEIHNLIMKLNQDSKVDGIFVQMPLPRHIDSEMAISHVDPNKDVDGLHPMNLGRLVMKQEGFLPCTPAGCIRLLQSTNVDFSGKKAVVIGRSILVGKPMALLLDQLDMTVTLCHSKTKSVEEECKTADVVVVAVGKPKWVKKEWLKPGAIVIDVGINRTEDNKIVGDVDYDDVFETTSFITPVPKGVGPMTIAMLMKNTVMAYRNHMEERR